LKLIIEIDLNRVHHDTFTGELDKHAAAKLVETAAERVRDLDLKDLLGCSYRIKDINDATVGSVTIQGDDSG
jgi:hypothetical protein